MKRLSAAAPAASADMKSGPAAPSATAARTVPARGLPPAVSPKQLFRIYAFDGRAMSVEVNPEDSMLRLKEHLFVIRLIHAVYSMEQEKLDGPIIFNKIYQVMLSIYDASKAEPASKLHQLFAGTDLVDLYDVIDQAITTHATGVRATELVKMKVALTPALARANSRATAQPNELVIRHGRYECDAPTVSKLIEGHPGRLELGEHLSINARNRLQDEAVNYTKNGYLCFKTFEVDEKDVPSWGRAMEAAMPSDKSIYLNFGKATRARRFDVAPVETPQFDAECFRLIHVAATTGRLEHLSMPHWAVNPEELLRNIAHHNTGLKVLDFCGGHYNTDGNVAAYKEAIRILLQLPSLVELRIGGVGIRSNMAVFVVEQLKTNTSLTSLTLRRVGSNDLGLTDLAQALRTNTCLRSFTIVEDESRAFTSNALKGFAEALGSTALHTLTMQVQVHVIFGKAQTETLKPDAIRAWEVVLDNNRHLSIEGNIFQGYKSLQKKSAANKAEREKVQEAKAPASAAAPRAGFAAAAPAAPTREIEMHRPPSSGSHATSQDLAFAGKTKDDKAAPATGSITAPLPDPAKLPQPAPGGA